MLNGGKILTLQRIPGHSPLPVTRRYALLVPEQLQNAVRFSLPLTFNTWPPLESKSPRNSRNFRGLGIEYGGKIGI